MTRVVEIGEIDPEVVVTPGIFVDRVVAVGAAPQQEARDHEHRPSTAHRSSTSTAARCSQRRARRRSSRRDIPPGSYVNLGIGQPTTVADYLPPELRRGAAHRERHAQHGSRRVALTQIDPDLINAGKIPVTELPGASYFHHADSFAMMRGGHLDVCVLGAFQVSEGGDLANWHTGAPDAIPAVGGAMDLAIGAK